MKIVSVIGARPQFIKSAMVSKALCAYDSIAQVVIHTGQHYSPDMSDVFFSDLQLAPPAYNLHVGSGTHGEQTGTMMIGIEKILFEEKPEWVMVYGDTNSTLAGALAAAKLNIRVAHVEAGLRSFNRGMPEEINRKLTDHLSQLLFTPTKTAEENVQREGIAADAVCTVGDVMYDAALYYAKQSQERQVVMKKHRLQRKQFILASIHRAENTDDPTRLRSIMCALMEVAKEMPVFLPLHPRTRRALLHLGLLQEVETKLQVSMPVGYLDMCAVEQQAKLIVTDSGGVQKEAYFYETPCVTLRDETEWVELVETGWNLLISPNSTKDMVAGIHHRLQNTTMRCRVPLYGDGQAATKIVRKLAQA